MPDSLARRRSQTGPAPNASIVSMQDWERSKRCPFCNERPMGAFPGQSRDADGNPAPWWRVSCACGAAAPSGMTVGGAFDRWNRRLG